MKTATGSTPETAETYGVQVPPPVPPDRTFPYAAHPRQAIDFWAAQGADGLAPLIFFVHGGAWRKGDKLVDTGFWKATHFPRSGFAFAATNYRLVPEATVEQQAEDAAAALRAVIDRAGELGIDRRRIILMGHSAGAHLVALLGTDESWLRAVGLSFADVAGVICNDGACYDAPYQIEMINADWRPAFTDAFGTEPERQRALSPLFHAAAPNVPHFLLLHMRHRNDGGIRQTHDLADALHAAGSSATVKVIEAPQATGHHELNLRMGEPGFGATLAVDRWLKERFGL
jgi:arylformamidase